MIRKIIPLRVFPMTLMIMMLLLNSSIGMERRQGLQFNSPFINFIFFSRISKRCWVYNLLSGHIEDSRKKHRLFSAVETIPCVTRKAKVFVLQIRFNRPFICIVCSRRQELASYMEIDERNLRSQVKFDDIQAQNPSCFC
ncbi:hypothetical protein MKX01_036588 [Papaver californicum]|nr:hypothetical protein MKX01_036588 [Papaver californicum]